MADERCPKCSSLSYDEGQCPICGYTEGRQGPEPKKVNRQAKTPSAYSGGTWRCKVPGCTHSLVYNKTPGGRKIAKHMREAHGPDLKVANHVSRGKAKKKTTVAEFQAAERPQWDPYRPTSDGYCPTCGGPQLSDAELRTIAALIQKGMAPQVAREIAQIATKAMSHT